MSNYSEGSGKSGKNGMTSKGVIERRQQFDPLLAQSRKVTADAAEHGHSLFGSETPGDLLLDFDHAQIALRLVVGSGPQLPPQLGRISCHFLRDPGSRALAPSGLDEPGVT